MQLTCKRRLCSLLVMVSLLFVNPSSGGSLLGGIPTANMFLSRSAIMEAWLSFQVMLSS